MTIEDVPNALDKVYTQLYDRLSGSMRSATNTIYASASHIDTWLGWLESAASIGSHEIRRLVEIQPVPYAAHDEGAPGLERVGVHDDDTHGAFSVARAAGELLILEWRSATSSTPIAVHLNNTFLHRAPNTLSPDATACWYFGVPQASSSVLELAIVFSDESKLLIGI